MPECSYCSNVYEDRCNCCGATTSRISNPVQEKAYKDMKVFDCAWGPFDTKYKDAIKNYWRDHDKIVANDVAYIFSLEYLVEAFNGPVPEFPEDVSEEVYDTFDWGSVLTGNEKIMWDFFTNQGVKLRDEFVLNIWW